MIHSALFTRLRSMLIPQHRKIEAAFRICGSVIVVLSGGVADGLLGAEPASLWTPLIQPRSFAAWREDHHGWKLVGDVALNSAHSGQLEEKPGDSVLVGDGDAANLQSEAEYQDVDVRLEFMIPQNSNAGVKMMGRYEIQILDTYGVKELSGDSCGGIYPRAEQEPDYHHIDHGVPPRVNAAKPAGEWQSLEIEFIAPRFDADGKKNSNARFARVVLNGKLIHENVEVSAPTGAAWRLVAEIPRGPLLLQGDHGRVAFRNIEVRSHH